MAVLSEQALEFAREHITKFYDSDFFPKPVEFEAIWHFWDEVKKDLRSRNVGKMLVTPPRTMPVPKARTGFRIVHQLEPLEALVYTALAAEVAGNIEAARAPVDKHVACSYRLKLSEGSFFGGGTGWQDFNDKTEKLAEDYEFVLVTDITDFYNQIYLHRLNNAIERADSALKPFADEIELFISTLNSKASQGVPVGPAASIVMSEAILIDVDEFIRDQGVAHTRYVDDLRIFSNTERELNRLLEQLTLYLYENHRLTISTEKTRVYDADDFVTNHLHNHYAETKIEIFNKLKIFNSYTEEYDEFEIPVDEEEVSQAAQLEAALTKILEFDQLELGLARSVIRAAKRNHIVEAADILLAEFDFFVPVVNDVALYLNEITNDDIGGNFIEAIESVIASPAVDNQLVRYWIEWYLSQHAVLLKSDKVRQFVFSSQNVDNQARAAITTNNVAWVRSHKTAIFNLGGWARRAVLNAARVLPSDERKHWLQLVINNSPVALDRWVANWVLKTT